MRMINNPVVRKWKMPAEDVSVNQPARVPIVADRNTFWNRHSTMFNFWLDALLLILFVIQGWIFAVLHVVFPRGAGSEWKIWGATPLDWSEALFITYCVFSVAIVLHVMFHWAWVCGVVATRFFGKKPGKDDGSHTLIGVGVLVFLVHVILIGVLIAKVSLVSPT